MKSIHRALKFGSGILIYFFSILHGFEVGFASGLFGSVIIVLGTLGFGERLRFNKLNAGRKKEK